jgi:AraC-like DNA-binding protein
MINSVRYLPVAQGAEKWGVVVTKAGLRDYPPHTAYPYKTHPADHTFTWESGRTSTCIQIVAILRGGGEIEGHGIPSQKIAAGEVFLLVPGVWHRFRPNFDTGWTEMWVDLVGPVVEELNSEGVLGPAFNPKPDVGGELIAAMRATHLAVQSVMPGVNPELSAQGFHLLALLEGLAHGRRLAPANSDPMSRVIRTMEKEYQTSLDLKKLSQDEGVPYSSFRRKFQEQTGFSPWQYVIHLRMEHARRSLLASNLTIDQLAGELGFSSSFHFSTAFKRHTGMAPTAWRKKMGALQGS